MKSKYNLIVDFIIVICGGLIMALSVMVSTQSSKSFDERTYWAIFAIFGFMMMTWGLSEHRRDKEIQKQDKLKHDNDISIKPIN